MNRDLISKLYTQAVDFCVEQGPTPDGTNKAWVWEEKFAELIVKECAWIADHTVDRGDVPSFQIKKYFGVTE